MKSCSISRRLVIADSGALIALAWFDLLVRPKTHVDEVVVASIVCRKVSRRPHSFNPVSSYQIPLAASRSN